MVTVTVLSEAGVNGSGRPVLVRCVIDLALLPDLDRELVLLQAGTARRHAHWDWCCPPGSCSRPAPQPRRASLLPSRGRRRRWLPLGPAASRGRRASGTCRNRACRYGTPRGARAGARCSSAIPFLIVYIELPRQLGNVWPRGGLTG